MRADKVLYAALVCEKFGMEEKAQYYLTAAKDPDMAKGGGIYKVLPMSTSLIHSIQGRIYASQGKTDDAVAGAINRTTDYTLLGCLL